MVYNKPWAEEVEDLVADRECARVFEGKVYVSIVYAMEESFGFCCGVFLGGDVDVDGAEGIG